MHKEEYDKWLEEFSNMGNVEIYTGGDYFSIFSESDAMLTDGLSFLVEYPVATGKPLIFFDSKTHQSLNQIGELALEYAYKVDNFEDFKSILDHLIKSKQNKTKDKMYEKRIEILEEMEKLLIPDKNPAEAILEDVLEDWYG